MGSSPLAPGLLGTRCGIVGTGYSVPERVLTNFDLEHMVETSDEWIRSRTGIARRHIAAPDESLVDLCERAAKSALEDAAIGAHALDLIIVATCTPDNLFPSTAATLQHRLGAGCGAFDLSAACSGFVYALVTAAHFLGAGVLKNVLVVGAEIMSRHVDWSDRNTCVLFADGAGAVVLSALGPDSRPGAGLLGYDLGADGAGGPLLSCGLSHEAGQNPKIFQNGREVYKFAVHVMGESAARALHHAGLSGQDVDLLVPHQANVRIIESAAKRLNLPMEKVFLNLENFGNTSAASIPIALAQACQAGRVSPGDTVLLSGFGAGLTWASAVLKWA